MKNLTIQSRILCEEIRQEKNNKLMLLGVFASGNILVERTPAAVPLAFYIEARIRRPGSTTVHVKMSGPGEGSGIMKILFETAEINQDVVVLSPRIEVLLECEGVLKLDISDDGENWSPVFRKRVTQQGGLWTLTPTSAGEPPPEQSPTDAPEKEKPRAPRRRASQVRKLRK